MKQKKFKQGSSHSSFLCLYYVLARHFKLWRRGPKGSGNSPVLEYYEKKTSKKPKGILAHCPQLRKHLQSKTDFRGECALCILYESCFISRNRSTFSGKGLDSTTWCQCLLEKCQRCQRDTMSDLPWFHGRGNWDGRGICKSITH